MERKAKKPKDRIYLVYLLFWMCQEIWEVRQNITVENNLRLFIRTSYYVAYCSQGCCLHLKEKRHYYRYCHYLCSYKDNSKKEYPFIKFGILFSYYAQKFTKDKQR